MSSIHPDDLPQMQRGISSLTLGPAVSLRPRCDVTLSDWQQAVVLSHFFRFGGDLLPVTATEVRLLWDETALYALMRCSNPGVQLAGSDILDTVELYLQPDICKPEEIDRFTIGCVNGRKVEQRRGGSTYTAVDVRWQVQHVNLQGEWSAMVTIPWQSIGGRPTTCFGLQIIRHRLSSGEHTSPSALDWYDEAALDLFMEVTYGDAPAVQSAAPTLMTLPSGKLRWQRSACLSWPTIEEQQAIKAMQQGMDVTTVETLAVRMHLLQRWVDLLILEGVPFLHEMSVWLPSADEYDPWTARYAVNTALGEGRFPNACAIVDRLLAQLAAFTEHWFTDGTAGNVDTARWRAIDSIDDIIPGKDEIRLSCRIGEQSLPLFLSFPTEGGIRLRGEKTGFFHSSATIPFTIIEQTAVSLVCSGAQGTVTIHGGEQWAISITDRAGKPCWQLGAGDLRVLFENNAIAGVDMSGNLTVDEVWHGFGERFEALNLHGYVISLWDVDSWDGLVSGLRNHAYKHIQFYHSSHGYSVFFNTTYRMRADIGNSNPTRYRITSSGPVFDLFITPGTPTEAVQNYVTLTGKPVLPPPWVFAPWAGGGGGRWSLKGTVDPVDEMIGVMQRFAELDIPHSAIYAEGDGSADARLFAALEPMNIRVLSWGRNQVFGRQIDLLRETDASATPELRWEDGSVVTYPQGQTLSAQFPYLDFTHPRALEVLGAFWKPRLDLGVAGTMVDFADSFPETAVCFDGRRGDEMHNGYHYGYHQTYYRLFQQRRGDDFILFTRAAMPGSQMFGGQFSGDHQSTFLGLTTSLHGGLNFAACGFPFWGCDIGGYAGRPGEEVYRRWVQWGAFSPLMRFHGTSVREPWYYSDASVPMYKRYAWLRMNLQDYIYAAAVAAHSTGIPIMRSLPFLYPDNQQVITCDDEYLFGPDLLVAPVHHEGTMRSVTFPPGRWTHLWDGYIVEGPVTREIAAPLDDIPVFLRAGAIIPVQLNNELVWGASMSQQQVHAVVITPPTAQETAIAYADNGEQKATFVLHPEEHGLRLQIAETRGETRYVILYGLDITASEVLVNQEQLSHLPDGTVPIAPGWSIDAQKRLIVRLPQGIAQDIQIS